MTNRVLARGGLELALRLPGTSSEGAHGALDDPGVALLLGMSARRPLTIVCVGAGHVPDGGDGDPALEFIRAFPARIARALLVEPIPFRLAATRRYLGDDARLTYVETAIGADATPLTLWQIDEWADGMLLSQHPSDRVAFRSIGHGWTSTDREHVVALLAQALGIGLGEARSHVQPVTVPTDSLASVLASAGIADVDYLQVDTEGWDDEVIASLDLDVCAPAVIRWEFVHLDTARKERLARHLSVAGYQGFTRIGSLDALCVRTTAT